MTNTFAFDGHSLAPALSLFAELLERRLQLRIFTTEDAVRYTFFIALIKALGLKPEDIILEYDHSAIARAKIDTWIPLYAGIAHAIEFKYDRPIPSQRNAPLTQKAGQVLKDIFRLAQAYSADKIDAVFIYLATREMAGYFSNQLPNFFNLKPGASLAIDSNYLDSHAATLRSAAGAVVPCTVDALLSRSWPSQHELRAWAVRRN